MIRVGLRALAARKARTALTMLAIVLGVGMVAAAFTVTDTMRRGVDSLSTATYGGTDAVVAGRQAFEAGTGTSWVLQRPRVDPAVLEQVRRVPSVAVAVGDIVDQQTKLIGRDGKPVGTGPYLGVGYDAGTTGAQDLSPLRIVSGRYAAGPGEVVIDQGTAEDQELRIGATVQIAASRRAEYRVVGIARFGDVKTLGSATVAVFDLATAQRALHREGQYDDILVKARDGVSGATLRGALADVLPANAVAQTAADNDRYGFSDLDDIIGVLRIALLVFGVIAILVGGFTIANALSITVAQRSRELGLLRMVGASRAQVLRSVLFEALVLGVMASVLGVAAGYGLAAGITSLFGAMGMALPAASMTLAAGTVIVAMIVGIVVTTLAGLVPAVRATRVAPVSVLREAELRQPRRLGRGVRAVVSVIGRPAERLGGTAGGLARRNAMRQPGRTFATAAALTIGVALVTLVTVIGAGMKDSTTKSLERRVSADHVVVATDDWSPMDPTVATDVAQAPGVDVAASIAQDAGQAFGDVEIVNGIDPKTLPSVLRFDWEHGSDAVPGALGADGAIVDDGWATEHKLGVGDRFTLTSAKGAELALTVRGIEHSPVLDLLGLGPITIGTPAYDGAFDNHRAFLTFVKSDDTAALKRALAAHPDVKLQSEAAWIDTRATSLEQLLAIFYVLLALAVIVSLFGIVNTLVLSTFERTRELGMLRAVGMSRRQMRRMVRHESVITALLGALVGIVVGLGLAAIVVGAFGDAGLTYVVPAGSLIAFVAVAVVAGVLAAIAPARRAAKMSPMEALSV
ncbi:MAG: putative transport system permease protein [Solirubrobacteraceae bacterium]|nr:putative transport system permease protein [Solirubrobacteraceae bacterium]